MWPLAIFLSLVAVFYWFAFMGTIWFCGNALSALLKGQFIRATIWACLGGGMIAWWRGTEVLPHPWDVDEWLRTSATVVGVVAVFVLLAKFGRWRKKRQAMQAMPTMPVWTPPAEAVGNIAPIIEVEYKRIIGLN